MHNFNGFAAAMLPHLTGDRPHHWLAAFNVLNTQAAISPPRQMVYTVTPLSYLSTTPLLKIKALIIGMW